MNLIKRAICYPIFALFAGCLMPLAFAPINFYPLAFFAPAVLLYTLLHAKCKPAFWRGYFFGLGFFAVGTSWVYISIHNFGNANTILSALITALLIGLMALYPATMALVFSFFYRKKSLAVRSLCFFPALWVTWEWLRSWLFTGFPWLLSGTSQIHTPLSGYAPIVGTFGVSLCIGLFAGALVVLAQNNIAKSAKVISMVFIFGLSIIGWILQMPTWTHPQGKPFKVSLIQGNIPIELKWSPPDLARILRVYTTLTAAHWDSQLIIWPEASIPTFPANIPTFMQALNQEAKQHHTTIILGAPIENIKQKQFYNGLIMLGENQGRYYKRHLVPFGEYTPLEAVFSPLIHLLNIPMSDFAKGPERQPPLHFNGMTIAPFICYEIAFPTEVIDSSRHAGLIVTISDDGWFGNSIALEQHQQMAQMRALETGRYVLLDSNTGVTAIIKPNGQIDKIAPVNKRTAISSTITAMQGNTPYLLWKNWPILMLVLTLLFAPLLL